MEQAQEIVNPETVPSMSTRCFLDYQPLLTGLAAEMRGPPPTHCRTVKVSPALGGAPSATPTQRGMGHRRPNLIRKAKAGQA